MLALGLAACGGGGAPAQGEVDDTATTPVAPAVADAPAADPNDPESVGAIVYEEEVPVPGTTLGAYDGLEVIPGLGDGAFWAAKNNRGLVWQDRVAAMISVYTSGSDLDEVEIVTSLGEALVARL